MLRLIGKQFILLLTLSLLTALSTYASHANASDVSYRGGGHANLQERHLGTHPGNYGHPAAGAHHPEARAYENGAEAGAAVGGAAGIGGAVIEENPVVPVEQTQPVYVPQ
ncbi:MAG: hypothetical protein WCF65_07945 [Parachlamydiaceae bacterium]